jgi:hypothetical protein
VDHVFDAMEVYVVRDAVCHWDPRLFFKSMEPRRVVYQNLAQ